MWCNQQFSLIGNNEISGNWEVFNIIVCDDYEMANQIARTMAGDSAFARDTTRTPVRIGDVFSDEKYFRFNEKSAEWEEVVPNPTEEQAIIQNRNLVYQLRGEYEGTLLETYEIEADQEYRLCCIEMGYDPFEE